MTNIDEYKFNVKHLKSVKRQKGVFIILVSSNKTVDHVCLHRVI